ncbi:signal transduction histidine kinase [Frankia torreyi]|uniref:histidine kinase n=1 Tax=Frankia torreyi TaxID=1856 RepID=A0A0D8BEY9_9ACTN|nr:histidine kinase [Frankia sp. ACN1ag]KJE22701.1 signal transduction histidine kinase [Frankia torreyi]
MSGTARRSTADPRVPTAPAVAAVSVVAVVAVVAAVVCAAVAIAWAVAGGGYFWPRWVWFGVATTAAAAFLLGWTRRHPPGRRRRLAAGRAVLALIVPVDVTVWALSGGGYFWPLWSITAWSILFGGYVWVVSRLPDRREQELTTRVAVLAHTRRAVLDGQAAELARVERDLHDGAQARMVSLALSLGMAEDLVRADPEATARLLREARSTAVSALDDLRTVMHSIHPAVLADRGLAGALRALALDLALPVTVDGDAPAQLPAAVQSAAYFATAECLANAVKHSQATAGGISLRHDGAVLRIVVTDDGIGGADPAAGLGLRGVRRRLETFDGRLDLDSPPGGPTVITITVPHGPGRLQ